MFEGFDVVLTGCIGLATTIVGSWASWFFARKKYNSEVENQVIDNMNDSLEFYKHLSDDTKMRLAEVLEQNREILKSNSELLEKNIALEAEVKALKAQVKELSDKIRDRLSDKKAKKQVKKVG